MKYLTEQNIPMYKVKLIEGKLCLTSQDIKVGDEVYSEQYNLKSTVIELINNSSRDVILKDMPHKGTFDSRQLVKIIGEISPDALSYVKEGMEYEEEQVMWLYKKNWDNILGKLDDKYFKDRKCSIAIKGPCGHFH